MWNATTFNVSFGSRKICILIAILLLIILYLIYEDRICSRRNERMSWISPKKSKFDWWERAVFYQIYPRSFKDDNNDGIGDLQGVISKLSHLKDAGITAAWLSPIYKSPQVDQGYDISDYRDIDPDYGTLEDMKELLEEAKKLGIKIIMDLVPNHTSNQHQWFIESEKGNETYKDYHVWRDAVMDPVTGERKPPNNWLSFFGNSTWHWSEKRQQYYLHEFMYQQPDLNFRNPAVLQEIKDVMTFWLNLGVAGFRVDAVFLLYEDVQFRDEPRSFEPTANPTAHAYLKHICTENLPESYNLVYEWREYIDKYLEEHGGDTRILMTEVYATTPEELAYYGTPDGKRRGAHFTFNFNLLSNSLKNSTAKEFADCLNEWLDNIPDIYTSNWVLGNHDNHRVATRFGPGNVDGFNMVVAILPGIGVTYNGEEIGMENGYVPYDEGQDPKARDPAIYFEVSRDFERTPFQWDDTINAGFNNGAKPWLPVSDKYHECNLKKQKIPNVRSHYRIYKDLLKLRKDDVLNEGLTEVRAVGNVLSIKRTLKENFVILVFNIGNYTESLDLGGMVPGDKVMVVLASVGSPRKEGSTMKVEGILLDRHEALVLRN